MANAYDRFLESVARLRRAHDGVKTAARELRDERNARSAAQFVTDTDDDGGSNDGDSDSA